MADARRMLVATILSRRPEPNVPDELVDDMNDNDRRAVKLFACLMAGKTGFSRR